MKDSKSFNRGIARLIKTTLIDYPSQLACSVFLKGCNLRCPYCYNYELLDLQHTSDDLVSFDEIVSHLKKRKNVLTGFVISGGEPLTNSYTEDLIKAAKDEGYKIKLDTNGLFPEKLEKLCSNKNLCPDYIAMDLKTIPEDYNKLGYTTDCTSSDAAILLKQSIDLISKFSSDSREWRTVLVPSLIDKNKISRMSQLLPSDAHWYFAQFCNDDCLDKNYEKLECYNQNEINEIIAEAKKNIFSAQLR